MTERHLAKKVFMEVKNVAGLFIFGNALASIIPLVMGNIAIFAWFMYTAISFSMFMIVYAARVYYISDKEQ